MDKVIPTTLVRGDYAALFDHIMAGGEALAWKYEARHGRTAVDIALEAGRVRIGKAWFNSYKHSREFEHACSEFELEWVAVVRPANIQQPGSME